MGSSLAPQETSVMNGYVRSFDGTKLFYSVEGKGKPLVFCYGLVCSSLHWTYQIEHFKNTYQTLWFDYRGHQNSDMPVDLKSLTLENLALDLKAVLDELKIQEAVFLGHSMGTNVVLEFCRKWPERVAGLVLANGTAHRPLETLFGRNYFQKGFQIFKRIYQKSPKAMALFWKTNKNNPLAKLIVTMGGFNAHLTPPGDIDLYMEQVAETDPAVLMQLMENYETYDATPWLHQIQTPTLVLAGASDRIIPVPQQELLRQLIPRSQLEVITHGSHCPQMDLPELVSLRIEKFLAQLKY